MKSTAPQGPSKKKGAKKKGTKKKQGGPKLPAQGNWRTSDQDEINRRRQRALEESLVIAADPENKHPVFGNFSITSPSGNTYQAQVRCLHPQLVSCSCRDFLTNGLRTCKHTEALLLWMQRRGHKKTFLAAQSSPPEVAIIGLSLEQVTLSVEHGRAHLPKKFQSYFDLTGTLLAELSPEEVFADLKKSRSQKLVLSQDLTPFFQKREQLRLSQTLQRNYESRIQSGEDKEDFLLLDLYPYQREGMLHLAFKGRALLADEMGLGKTAQAIAAAALLHKLGEVQRVLVITPASLKSEWQEQISKFSPLSHGAIYGGLNDRKKAYRDSNPPFFLIANYEQILRDVTTINEDLRPDLVILDESQRIKNWTAKTAQAIKKLKSPRAFVLTGTPLENRIDELYSLVEFLDPTLFGPLFRFNRDFYDLDESGKAIGYKNLQQLHQRIQPIFLRRRKSAIADSLPSRSDRHILIEPTEAQKHHIADHEQQVSLLAARAAKRPLRKEEHDKLMRELAMVRMSCDTNFILDKNGDDRSSSKMTELQDLIPELLENSENKIIVFSEWERMLIQLREEVLDPLGVEYAWHTGSVPQKNRRPEITRFKTSPTCRLFLTTDCGGTGLNLQCANIVINLDLPWNPARLEQRIARAWRKHQTQPVSVINLVAKGTLEERMIDTLATKQQLADGVLDGLDDLDSLALGSSRERLLKRLAELTGTPQKEVPTDPLERFLSETQNELGETLLDARLATLPNGIQQLLLVVTRHAKAWKEKLKPAFEALALPSQPLLEVIDQETYEAMQRFLASGLLQAPSDSVSMLTRGGTEGARVPELPPLTPEQFARLEELSAQAARQLKLGKFLLSGDFTDEARPPLLAGQLAAARAQAILDRQPEPETLAESEPDPASQTNDLTQACKAIARSIAKEARE